MKQSNNTINKLHYIIIYVVATIFIITGIVLLLAEGDTIGVLNFLLIKVVALLMLAISIALFKALDVI